MSMLFALVQAYERMAQDREVPPFGYSSQKIGYLISLHDDGSPAHAPIRLVSLERGQALIPLMVVPQPAKRTRDVAPSFLWDKTSYVLGVTAKASTRTQTEHAAFVDYHDNLLRDTDDEGLRALRAFLHRWRPADFEALGWPDEMMDQNVAFALESQREAGIHLHDRPAARAIWNRVSAQKSKSPATCLVTGKKTSLSRIHPAIKGVRGAQTSGAAIVSFNLDAFTSYGHEFGANAPVGEDAAFAYTTVLNRFLELGSQNRLQLGEATMVFWAEGRKRHLAEQLFASMLAGKQPGDVETTNTVRMEADALLAKLQAGAAPAELAPESGMDTRLFAALLAPNASRLAVCFFLEEDLATIAARYRQFIADIELEPGPPEAIIALRRCVLESAALAKRENMPLALSTDFVRSVFNGTDYPLTLFSTLLMRMRADKDINALRIALLKAVLVRNFKMEVPVALDPAFKDKAYLIGRLFATYEHIQYAAIGSRLNATFKNTYYPSASANPRKIFHQMELGSIDHLRLVAAKSPGYRVVLERTIAAILEEMSPADEPFPAFLSPRQQALFGLGYHHQRSAFAGSRPKEPMAPEGGEAQ